MLNKNDLANNALFSGLQGNILNGHGRDFTANIFVRFDKNRVNRVKEWISDFSKEKITSCKKQLSESELYKRNKVSGGVFFGILLSADGYEYLGMDVLKFESAFQKGMKQASINDPDSKNWEEGFKKQIHAMILIGDDDPKKLGNACFEICEEIDKFSSILTIEHGNAIRNAHGDGLEHFGYVDGISQPLFFDDELKNYEEKHGKDKFDPSADTELVLVKDPFANSLEAYGSYFVFRKLEQNVRQFKKAENRLGKQLKLDNLERAGASLVGRFEDGTPVQVNKDDGIIGSGIFNNFNYTDPTDNSKCPYHAHIRKTNPRTPEHKKHIMARRGIPYGLRNVPTSIEQNYAQMPENGVGLLFMSFQSSITNQFEHIQRLANDSTTYPGDSSNSNNLDPIIGQDGTSKRPNKSIGMLPVHYEDSTASSLKESPFNLAVTLKGGEYFFAPSIPFLNNLKEL